MMLTGAFPMVTLIRKYLSKPLEKLGRLAGLEASGSIGILFAKVLAVPQVSREAGQESAKI